ncbi:hypothetical protein HBI56_115500 [Parastagonospora nodorum]|uniref:Uncharacterized protein n=1 Tax=Phaeosphaeria nodorum (strain SN15 / ATCC MYA-4574 / FGSC 10173) TaxID=321614 RepID=A0A7U2I277_PHANO|nr:hypothetical protein HBH56_196360 [Parastagonospora nodorum]QRD00606.1 hypothetical protein JI435_415400 [Parastagonospora nodorum SN15]KAH3924977.1 hypothetical protein HBH54_187130 [Parastagonospora nodorum]KAH3984295.1 hypothetical protein HBH51_029430 [Parastagonospora nodorum]KAH4051999.1 hypothetical protein HBH49_110690 [Parastagonospora nodorum]
MAQGQGCLRTPAAWTSTSPQDSGPCRWAHLAWEHIGPLFGRILKAVKSTGYLVGIMSACLQPCWSAMITSRTNPNAGSITRRSSCC